MMSKLANPKTSNHINDIQIGKPQIRVSLQKTKPNIPVEGKEVNSLRNWKRERRFLFKAKRVFYAILTMKYALQHRYVCPIFIISYVCHVCKHIVQNIQTHTPHIATKKQ
jgi:hypothetical protein